MGDRIGADFYFSVQTIIDRLGANPIPIQIPIGRESEYRGSIDLITMKAYVYDDETLGAKYKIEEIPADLMDKAKEYREKMLEAVAEFDDQVMEKYLNGQALTEDAAAQFAELARRLRARGSCHAHPRELRPRLGSAQGHHGSTREDSQNSLVTHRHSPC